MLTYLENEIHRARISYQSKEIIMNHYFNNSNFHSLQFNSQNELLFQLLDLTRLFRNLIKSDEVIQMRICG